MMHASAMPDLLLSSQLWGILPCDQYKLYCVVTQARVCEQLAYIVITDSS